MSQILEQRFIREVPEIISSWFGGEKGEVSFEHQKKNKLRKIDLVQKIQDYTFVIECKKAGTTALVADAINNLQKSVSENSGKTVIPVIAVPFMGEAGRELCERAEISWLDLSGNAHVTAPGLRIQIEGKPNKFKSIGRPKNLFAPKSSRIAREFLMNPGIALTQRELAKKTRLNETLVGRIVRELERENLLARDKTSNAVYATNSDLLLDAWRESYQFDKHSIIHAFAAQRTGEATMHFVAEGLEKNNIVYAATGLAGAWLLTHFAAFRVAVFYLKEFPSPDLLKDLKITEQPKSGANVWLVFPNDEGVFEGVSTKENIACAHPVQIYLDLKNQAERAAEAAESVRREFLDWGNSR